MQPSVLNSYNSCLLREERTIGENQSIFNRKIGKYSIVLGKRVSRGRSRFIRDDTVVCREGVLYLGTNFGWIV